MNPSTHHTAPQPDLAQLASEVEAALAGLHWVPEDGAQPRTLFAPMAYMLGLPAKRSRPILTLVAYLGCTSAEAGNLQQRLQAALPLALAVELFHNFTLLHDDIMDRAATRRGHPTVHTHWDEPTAILAGDALLVEAYRLLAQGPLATNRPNGQVAERIETFSQVALDVCRGQQLDLDLAQRDTAEVALPEYLEMIRLKTAVLLGGALWLGAHAALAPEAETQALRQFGEDVGVAFQLQDDYMDTYAAPEDFGKTPGGDILENKKTFLWLHAWAHATPAQQAELRQWATDPDADPVAKIATIRALYEATGVPQAAQQAIRSRYEAALERIAGFEHRGWYAPMVAFAQSLRGRIR